MFVEVDDSLSKRIRNWGKKISKNFSILNLDSAPKIINRFSSTYIQAVRRVYDIAEQLYPGMVDIQITLEEKTKAVRNTYGLNQDTTTYHVCTGVHPVLCLVIKFPEIGITNMRHMSHTIKDLYVRMNLMESGDRVLIHSLKGVRGNCSCLEYRKNYAHSHISTTFPGDIGVYKDFCLGSNQPIHELLEAVNDGSENEEEAEDKIRLLLIHIGEMVKWESLEGRPYRKLSLFISEEGGYSKGDLSTEDKIFYYKEFLKRFIASPTPTNINWYVDGGNLKVVEDGNFEKIFHEVFSEEEYNDLFWEVDETGKMFRRNYIETATHGLHDSEKTLSTQENSILFKGEYVEFFVYPHITLGSPAEETIIKFIDYEIKNYVKHRIEGDYNSAYLRESGIKRLQDSC